MKPEEFCYWLQGSIELNDNCEFNENQTAIVKRHLAMVFEHIAHLDEKDQPDPYAHLQPISSIKERC